MDRSGLSLTLSFEDKIHLLRIAVCEVRLFKPRELVQPCAALVWILTSPYKNLWFLGSQKSLRFLRIF